MAEARPNTDDRLKQEDNRRPTATSSEDTVKTMQQAVTTAEPESDVKTEEHTVKDCSQQLIDEDDKKREGEKKQEGNGQVGDQSKGEKPVPAMRRKKKNGLVAAEGGLLEKDSKEEHASEHAQGGSKAAPDDTYRETIPMEHCVFDMLRLDNISGLDQERVRIFYKDNAAIVEGIEEEEVNKVSYNILGFEENVCHTQIHLNHGTVMLEFLTRQNVQMYINDMLRKISVTCRWELNSDNTAIEVYVYGKNRLKEALETIQNSFCVEEIVSVEKSLVCHLWKTALWKAHIKKLKERLNNKVEYEQSETADKIIVIYTQDLEKVAIDNMHQIEQNLEADIIYKPTDEAFKLLSNIDIEPIPSVTYTILKEHQCILFDGDEGKIQKARLTVRKTARTIKVEKISVHPMVPLSFFRTTTFLTMLNKALESKKLRVFWEVNDTDYSVDVFAFDDQMKETVNVVKQSYCLEKFEFADDVESLEHFKANIRLLEKGDKLICIVDNQTVIVVCTSDLIAQVTEVRKECENVSITMNVFCKESAVYKFIAINKVHLAEIEEKYSVSISPIDDKCTFVIKGKKDKLPAARDSLTGLMNQKISKESMQVGEPRFLKFENGEYETVCQEFEKFSRVLIQSSETAFDDVGLNVDDSDIILTNRRYKPELESKTAVMVARDEIKDTHVKVEKENTIYTISCSASVIRSKLEGGKNKENMSKLFESIFKETEKGNFATLVMPLEDLIESTTAGKFVKYFLNDFQTNISRKAYKHIPEIVFQVCNRSKFLTLSAAAAAFLTPSPGQESKSKTRKVPVIGIKIQEGELAKAKADVIVNSVGQDFVLSKGLVSKSLLNKAGDGLRLEVSSRYPEALQLWSMASTSGHSLLCQKVFHLVLDGFPDDGAKNKANKCITAFGNLIKECLCEMENNNFKTIAFPVLGTGNLGYKVEDVANIMITAVGDYNKINPLTCIQNITIYVYSQVAANTKKVFEERLQKYPKLLTVPDTERTAVSEEPEKYELVVVGLKDDVVKAKAYLMGKFQAEDKEAERKAEKASQKELVKAQTDPRPEKNLIVSRKDEGLKASKPGRTQQLGDLSPMNKLLGDVKVEIKEGFIKRLPDAAILQILGFFKVSKVCEGSKSWLKGKITDLEKARDFLLSVVGSSDSNQIEAFDITKDLYDLLCSKFGKLQDRFSFDPPSNKVSILEKDKEMIDFLKKYKHYQFDELLPKSDTVGNDAENDERAAEDLKEEKSDFQSVEVFVSSKDSKVCVLKIAAPDFTILRTFKFALEVKTGRQKVSKPRHGRAEAESDILKPSTHTSYKFATPDSPTASNVKESKGEFTTTEGIKVYVYKHDILKLEVDCIVNAANKEMRHGGGVAKVIARAAGHELERDSRRYVNAFGDLSVGSCCSTSAGNLNYKCIIHTVGPDIKDYRKYEYPQMRRKLRQAVSVCFEEAERQNCRSIGMTSISSGVYGVPKPWCAEEYARAVKNYSSNPNRSTLLKEIHFVDISEEMLNEIKDAFQTVLHNTDDREFKENRDGHDSSYYRKVEDQQAKQYPKCYRRDKKWVFELKQDFRIVIYTEDITQFKMGAIACSQDSNLSSAGGIAKALSKHAGPTFQDNLKKMKGKGKKLKTGDVVVTDTGDLNCAAIYHIVIDFSTAHLGQKALDGFLKDYHKGYVNCLHEVQRRGLSKIAIPLFGCGLLKDKVDTLVETFHNAMLSFSCDPKVTNSELSEVHVINDREGVTHKIKTVFLKYVEATTESPDPDNLDAKSEDKRNREPVDKDRDTGHREGDKEDTKGDEKGKHPETDLSTEKCPICMDTFDNPKKLSKCGHVFCTDCIEAQFKVTPKCPNCFMVYGVIMGDQPEGKMSSFNDYRSRLPGYENYSTIVITYDFPDGVQGPDHPQPGTRYRGIRRNGYLPDNKDGRQILKMLEIAFKRKLVFTIGSSRTTGKEGVITWNDIHHKTDPRPHSTFGYPDPSYLERVKDELAAKGVTPDDIK